MLRERDVRDSAVRERDSGAVWEWEREAGGSGRVVCEEGPAASGGERAADAERPAVSEGPAE